MTLLITCYSTDKLTGRRELIVSHGIDDQTGHGVVIPPVHPREVGGVFDHDIGEWVIRD